MKHTLTHAVAPTPWAWLYSTRTFLDVHKMLTVHTDSRATTLIHGFLADAIGISWLLYCSVVSWQKFPQVSCHQLRSLHRCTPRHNECSLRTTVHGLFVPSLDDSYHVEKGDVVYTVQVKKPLRFSYIFSKTVGNV